MDGLDVHTLDTLYRKISTFFSNATDHRQQHCDQRRQQHRRRAGSRTILTHFSHRRCA